MEEGKFFLLALPGLEVACCVTRCILQIVHHDKVLTVGGTVQSSGHRASCCLGIFFSHLGTSFSTSRDLLSQAQDAHV